MAEFLVFTLAAPMGAFGDLAGHERRGSAGWPGRSAILGLVGAALGTRRDDPEGLSRLAIWRMAVAVLAAGAPLRDYHTAQTIPSSIRRPATRAEALARARAEGKLNTVLTSRDYVTDCAYGVALWGGDPGPVAEALSRPAFVPYLGRKSCPLAAPMAPAVVLAEDPLAALCNVQPPTWMATASAGAVYADPWPGLAPRREERRWDDPGDRATWAFTSRIVHVHDLFAVEERSV